MRPRLLVLSQTRYISSAKCGSLVQEIKLKIVGVTKNTGSIVAESLSSNYIEFLENALRLFTELMKKAWWM